MKTLLGLVVVCAVLAAHPDLVVDLPNFPYKGTMYSGYLDLDNPAKKLHYMFVESSNDPEKDPLVLWLNGGPGCSSMLGWAQEHGPAMFPEESVQFELNPFSWNKAANMLYIESPAGVGYSFVNSDEKELWESDDIKSGVENLQAMLSFFRKFPGFKSHDFYISGESYAGIYVPMLANNILEYNKKQVSSRRIKLKGILVGNGVTDWSVDTTPAMIDFAWSHGLYSPEDRAVIENVCFRKVDEKKCERIVRRVLSVFSKLNVYDIYRKCVAAGPRELDETGVISTRSYKYTPWVNQYLTLQSENNFLAFLSAEDTELGAGPSCIDDLGPAIYFNRDDVRKALHIDHRVGPWMVCSDKVHSLYKIDTKNGSLYLYHKLLNKIRILVYSGDTDAAVPVDGTRKWIHRLDRKILSPWKKWRVNENEVAGYVTEYEGLTFVTIKGTGHMVPQWKPKEAYKMFDYFLKEKTLD